MPKVNPKILRWARETSGLTIEEAAEKLHLGQVKGMSPVERLAALEGTLEGRREEPSRAVLLTMARQYHRPLLTFYMSAPPRKGERGEDLRTLPESHTSADDALLDVLLREIRARQDMLRAALEAEEETDSLSFVGSMRMSDGLPAFLSVIKEKLQFDLTGFRSKRTAEDAFALLRGSAEAAGIFVLLVGDLGSYHTAMDLKIFRGFTLADPIAPFVVINNHDSRAAWSFTLLHEVTHLWLGQTAISGMRADKPVEQFCNDVAGELLLPSRELAEFDAVKGSSFNRIMERISGFAYARNLSSSMVAYKLFRKGMIDKETWERLHGAFYELWREQKARERRETADREGGPSYYVVHRYAVGTALINLVQRLARAGALTTSKAGLVLGIKAGNMHKLVDIHGA